MTAVPAPRRTVRRCTRHPNYWLASCGECRDAHTVVKR